MAIWQHASCQCSLLLANPIAPDTFGVSIAIRLLHVCMLAGVHLCGVYVCWRALFDHLLMEFGC